MARPDGGYSREVHAAGGEMLGVVPEGNRKDIRNAVEAAAKAGAWRRTAAHARAQVLYYIAENLLAHAARFEACLAPVVGADQARAEIGASARRLFTYAAWADKYDGAVHQPPLHGLALALRWRERHLVVPAQRAHHRHMPHGCRRRSVGGRC